MRLWMRYKRALVSYELISDFFLALIGVPIIIVEVYSKSQAYNQNCMLVQESSLVQLANSLLVRKGKEPNFILMAIYFNKDGFSHHLIYQDETRACGYVIYMVLTAERTQRTKCCVWRKYSLTCPKTGFGWFMKYIIWSHNRKQLKGTKWSMRTCLPSHSWTVAWMLSQQQRRRWQGDNREVGDM